jgi:hypothetical protein
MIVEMPTDWIREAAAIADGFMAMPVEVMMRFGKWDDILAAPEPPEYLPIARAMRLYARGVANAAQGNKAEARAEQTAFIEAKGKITAEATFGNNKAVDILAVAEQLLNGEILIREGKVDATTSRRIGFSQCGTRSVPPWCAPIARWRPPMSTART